MNLKKEIKESYLSIRIAEDSKIAFKKVAIKRGKKVSEILLEFIENQIEIEGVSKYVVPANQMEIPMQ